MTNSFNFQTLQLETDRLFIRPYQLGYANDLFIAISDPDFYQYIPEKPPTINEVKDIIKWSIECNHKNSLEKIYKLNLGIIIKEKNQLIGYYGLGPYDLDSTKIEIYYGLQQDFRGKGLVTEAVKALLEFGFTTLQLEEVVGVVFPQNSSSVRILERVGMKRKYTISSPPEEHQDFEGMDYYSINKNDYVKE